MLNGVVEWFGVILLGDIMNTPNLFSFAPSELSQDAFFAWLFSFADKKYQNGFKDLHEVSQKLLYAFIQKCRPDFQIDIQAVDVKTQYSFTINELIDGKIKKKRRKIDILIVINDDFRIVIESKTNSKEHGNQLYDYAKHAIEKNWDFIGIYLKTGNEAKCFLNQIPIKTRELGIKFEIFNRQEILSVLNSYPNIDNDIFISYLSYLQNIEDKTQSFKSLPIKDWNSRSWQGLYEYLDNLNHLSWWDYVPNPSGGFWAANFKKSTWQDYSVVFAIHQQTLVFGVFVTEKDKQTKIRNQFSQFLLKSAKEQGLSHITKPKFGKGEFMQVAQIKQKDWLGGDDERIDLENVVSILNKYHAFFQILSDK